MPLGSKVDHPRHHWDRLFGNPGQTGLITSIDAKGRVNAGTFATIVRVVHDPVHIAFTTGLARDTYANVKETGEFVVNFPPFERELLEKLCVVGLHFERGVNELDKAGLTAMPAVAVKPPRVLECKRHFECRLMWTKEWVERVMIVGEVVAVSTDEGCADADGFLDWQRTKPFHFCGASYLNKPPHQHVFVAAYETMGVDLRYDGPERPAVKPEW